jgi:MinD-like ATPase involved in chromosome partitioning or flagellar assembly
MRTARTSLFGNLLTGPQEAAVLPALVRMMRDFLSLDVTVLGQAPASPAVHESVNRRRPVTLEAPSDPAAVAFRRAAVSLLEAPLARSQRQAA